MRSRLQQTIDGIKVEGKNAGPRLLEAIDAIAVGDKGTGARLLADLLHTNPRDESAWLWMAYAVDDIGRKQDCLKRMLALNEGNIGRAGLCLLSYDYPALDGITEEVRRDFAFTVAWRHGCRHLIWDGANEPLAVLVGADYVLDIDVDTLCRDLGTSATDDTVLPISYEQRADLWPDLGLLQALSLPARKVFLRVMQRVDLRSGLAHYYPRSFFTDRHECIPGFHDALAELAEAGFVDLNPTSDSLMMHLTAKDLKRFAFDHGVKPRGSKHELIQQLIASVDMEAMERLLKKKLRVDATSIRVAVDNFPLLKKHIWAEAHRLGLYCNWVRIVHCLDRSPQTVFFEQARTAADAVSDRDNEPPARWDDRLPQLTRTELLLVRKIWDSKCDTIVRELADRYAWDAPWYIKDAVVAYLPVAKLEQFKRACEEDETHVWYNLFFYYGKIRLAEMKVEIRKPRQLTCTNCEKKFLESSIPASLAQRVGYRIHFCRGCCSMVFYGAGKSTIVLDQENMLERLAELARALGSVPSGTFVQNPQVAGFSDERLVGVMKALIRLPSYKAYVDTFGSWLKALVLAGVLEDGTQRTGRGTRCIADDGHECLSLAEKTIDDWLSAHHIAHEIEPSYPYHAQLNPAGLRADWKVGETFIEYAGLMSDPEYATKMETKKKLSAKSGIPLIVLEPEDVLNLDEKLAQFLDE